MKKKLCIIAVTAAFVFAFFSWFHVSGKEIRYVKDISADCTVTVTVFGKTPTTGIGTGGWKERETYTLTAGQTEELKQLLLSTTFRRNPADTILWESDKDKMRYDIFVDFGDGQRTISIHGAGNHHLSISGQFSDHFLMIRNDNWEETLCGILA